MIATIVFLLAATAASPPAKGAAVARCSAPVIGECLQGTWSGSFADANWTFEIVRRGDSWTGRYVSSRSKEWHPLLNLRVADDALAFAIDSRPQVRFRLKLDRTTDLLAGDVGFGNVRAMPFTASRKR
jgi:hypothetical protein